jgi:glycosyltransferase involved in cell wall biosynthesis
VVKKFAEEDSRIILYENEKNTGLAAVRNRGLSLAHGEYVYFLDSDDKIRADALGELYRRGKKEKLDVQIFGADFIYETDELKERFKTNPCGFKQEYSGVLSGKELFQKWMAVWDWMPSQPRFFYEREFLQRNNLKFPEGMLHEDEIFTFDVLISANRIRVTCDRFFIRRFRQASIMTGGPGIKNVEGCVRILDHVRKFLLRDLDKDSPEGQWNEAVLHYMYKIFRDASGKYRRALANGAGMTDAGLSDDIRRDEGMMAIFHMIEAFGIWEDR